MKGKKVSTLTLVLIAIAVLILLVIFLNLTLKNIRTVKTTITESSYISDELEGYAQRIGNLESVAFLDGKTLFENDVEILLVDHMEQSAAIVREGEYSGVEYEALDKRIINCNSYTATIDDKITIIINCDEILDDPVVRAVVASYVQGALGFVELSPEEVEYFPSADMDAEEGYYRYMMIEGLKKAVFEGENLKEFAYYYDGWTQHMEGKNQLAIMNFDYYDGIKEYIGLKVKMYEDGEFDAIEYLNGYLNEFGIYDKNEEHRVLGLLWCLLQEREGEDIYANRSWSDIYRYALRSTPYVDVDEADGFELYKQKFDLMTQSISEVISSTQQKVDDVPAVKLALISENYGDVIKVGDGKYIYCDFKARDENLIIIEKDYMLAEISSLSILYYCER